MTLAFFRQHGIKAQAVAILHDRKFAPHSSAGLKAVDIAACSGFIKTAQSEPVRAVRFTVVSDGKSGFLSKLDRESVPFTDFLKSIRPPLPATETFLTTAATRLIRLRR